MESTTIPVTPVAVGIRYGIYSSLIWIVLDVVLRMTGLSFKYSVYTGAVLIVWVVGLILAHRFYKSQHGGFMTFKQGLMISIIIGLVWGVIIGLFNYIYVNFIDVDYLQRQRDDMEAWLSTFPNMTDEQVEKSLAGMSDEKGKSLKSIGANILYGGIFNLVLGLIVSAFTKHTRPEFE